MTADDTLEREIAELEAALAAPMRDARPEPRLAFTADLDRRVTAGFPRRRRRLPSLAVPGLALSGAAAAVIAVVALTGGGGGRGSTPAMDSAGGGSSVSGATAQQDKAAPSIAAPAPPAG